MSKVKNFLSNYSTIIKYGISIVLIVFFIYFYLIQNFIEFHDEIVWEVDEAAWIYSTYYYHLAFEKNDFKSKDWFDQDAKDHPPIAKFIFGFALSFIDQVPHSLDSKKWWFNHSDYYQFFWKQIKAKVDKDALVLGRTISLTFYIISIFLFFYICQQFVPLPIAVLSCYYLISNPVIIRRSSEILSDGILLFFLLITLITQMTWIKKLINSKTKNFYLFSILLGISFGFIFQTKINGLLSVIALILFLVGLFIFKNRISYSIYSKKILFTQFIIVMITFLGFSYLINPSLYSEPITFMKSMYDYRFNRISFQQEIFGFDSIPNISLSLSTFFKRVMMTHDYLFRFHYIPILQLGFIAGVFSIIKNYKSKFLLVLIGVNAAVWIGAISINYKLDWNRYLIPTFPFLYLCMGIGINFLWDMRKEFPNNLKNIFYISIIASALIFTISHYDLKYYFEKHPEYLINKEINSLEFQLKRYDQDKGLWIRLRDEYNKLGNHLKVEEIKSIIDQLNK